MTISIIAAVSTNGVIGNNNSIPWDIPDDLRRFKRLTTGKPIIMGRKTFESIGNPLPDRLNIVVSNSTGDVHPGVRTVTSLDKAIELAESYTDGEIFLIGGEGIYREAILQDHVETMYLTTVHDHVEGDAHFPMKEVLWDEWVESERMNIGKEYSFFTYERVEEDYE